MTPRKGHLVRQGSHNTAELVRVSEEYPLSIRNVSTIPRHIEGLQKSLSMEGTCILVMGLTGSGKSTFISKATQRSVPIGHSLGSCTAEVRGYPFRRPNNDTHWLVDTPGFDDTNNTNARILRNIVSFLCAICSTQRLSIGGVLYFHRITDTRMPSSSLKSLRILEKICGESAFRDVTILTTRWDTLQSEDAIQAAVAREIKLRDSEKHFGRLCKGGAAYERYGNDFSNSVKIIEDILGRSRTVPLEVQLELERDKQLQLADTVVGRYLEGDLNDTRKRCQSRMAQLETLSEGLEADTDALAVELAKQHKVANNAELDMGHLSVTFEDMRKDWEYATAKGSEATVDFASGGKGSSAGCSIIHRQQMVSQGVMKEQEAFYRSHERRTEGSPARDRSTRDRSRKTSSTQWQDFVQAILIGPSSTMVHEQRRSTSVPGLTREWRHRDDKSSRSKRAPQSRERRRTTKLSYQDSLYSTDCDSDTSFVQQVDVQEEDDDTSSEDDDLRSMGFTVSHTQHAQGSIVYTDFQPTAPTYDGNAPVAVCNSSLVRIPGSPSPTYTRTPPKSSAGTLWQVTYSQTSGYQC